MLASICKLFLCLTQEDEGDLVDAAATASRQAARAESTAGHSGEREDMLHFQDRCVLL